jgi:hypothetical protein
MNLNVSLAEWVEHQLAGFPSLSGLSVVTMGDTENLSPPFLGIAETGADRYEQDGVPLHGVTTYEITVELVTVPAEEDQEGTPPNREREMRLDLYDILGNRDAIEWINGRNFWQVFDIRTGGPITEAQEGTRVSRWVLTVVAAPF